MKRKIKVKILSILSDYENEKMCFLQYQLQVFKFVIR